MRYAGQAMTDKPASDPFERGEQLRRKGKLMEAAACYREALSRRADDHRA